MTTRLYARHLPPEQLEAFDAAEVGKLDNEIKLAKSNLDWAIAQWQSGPLLGVVTNRSGKAIGIKPWIDVVREHQDIVRKLELARAQILARGFGDDKSERGALEEFMDRINAGQFETAGLPRSPPKTAEPDAMPEGTHDAEGKP